MASRAANEDATTQAYLTQADLHTFIRRINRLEGRVNAKMDCLDDSIAGLEAKVDQILAILRESR